MITKENAIPGTEVMYGDHQTVIEAGSYDDPELGFMLKTARFPGGYPAKEFRFIEEPAETPEVITEEALPAVTFELEIIDEKNPVKITPALIKEKSKPLTDLVILNYLDDKGYEAVKKALASKAVKTRTAIEKKEKEVLKDMKSRHASEIKELTDYTAELYIACKEVEKDLQDKINTYLTEKAAEAKKLADAEEAKTTGRDNAMYSLGLTFNGQAFVGYGKTYTKNSLYSLDQASYDALLIELEGLQLEQSVTGEVKAALVATAERTSIGSGTGYYSFPVSKPSSTTPDREYPTALYDKTLPDGTRIVLTKGEIIGPEAGAKVVNDRVGITAVYVQVI